MKTNIYMVVINGDFSVHFPNFSLKKYYFYNLKKNKTVIVTSNN